MSKFLDTLKGLEVSKNLLHRVVITEEGNARQGTQSAKTRSETRGGGRKPYKQKKTGNARQGTIRAPHYAHGGMALAVKPRDYSRKVNKKERRLALLGAFADKLSNGQIVVLDKLGFAAPKSKEAMAVLKKNEADNIKRVLIIVADHDINVVKSFANIPHVEVRTAPRRDGKGEGFSTRDIVLANKILITKDALAVLEQTYGAEEATPAAPKKKTTKKENEG